eukprot:tig00020816_g14101.t1
MSTYASEPPAAAASEVPTRPRGGSGARARGRGPLLACCPDPLRPGPTPPPPCLLRSGQGRLRLSRPSDPDSVELRDKARHPSRPPPSALRPGRGPRSCGRRAPRRPSSPSSAPRACAPPARSAPPARPRSIDEGATAARMEALRRLRRALSAEEGAPIARALSMGLFERLARVLGEASAEHRMEAAWICTNIATGTHEETAAVAALSPQLIALAASGDAILQEQGAWALGNIAGDGVELRDKARHPSRPRPRPAPRARPAQLRAEGAAPPSSPPPRLTAPRLARPPAPPARPARPARPLCHRVLVARQSAWALTSLAVAPLAINPPPPSRPPIPYPPPRSYLTAGEDGNARQLIDAGVVSAMAARVANVQRPTGGRALTPLLRALGNVASGPPEHVALICTPPGAGPAFLEALRRLLASEEHRATAKEAAWIVSNVTGTGPDYADAALGAGLLPPLAHLLSSAPFDAAFAVANLGADGRHAVALVQAGCLHPFLQACLLRAPDAEIARAALSFVHVGPRLVEEADGIDAIESLQMGQAPHEAPIATYTPFPSYVSELQIRL